MPKDARKSLGELVTAEEPELVFGVVAPVGSDRARFESSLRDTLAPFGYDLNVVRFSSIADQIYSDALGMPPASIKAREYERISRLMDIGTALRTKTEAADFLALHAINSINLKRTEDVQGAPLPRVVHLLWSLKHPKEVESLRRVYGPGFFLIGLHTDEPRRYRHLTRRSRMTDEEARQLLKRDQSESGTAFGQQTRSTFRLADAFLPSGDDVALRRFVDLIFGEPFATPTRDEQAMSLAYMASMRSAQLGRQVGAVILDASGDVIAVGANEVPKAGGGLYWCGDGDARDHVVGWDANNEEIAAIVAEVTKAVRPFAASADELELKKAIASTRIGDLTEYGRVVHAEMEALSACARVGVSPKNGTLYTTTFPCHNCTKHIVAAGLARLVYVEPYPKSKAHHLHFDSISVDESIAQKGRVNFVPFIGISARRYFDLFAMTLGTGFERSRKDEDERPVHWKRKGRMPRLRMSPFGYVRRESIAIEELDELLKKIEVNSEQPEAVLAQPSPAAGKRRRTTNR